jgi:hypothetical protein
MSRRNTVKKRYPTADSLYNSYLVSLLTARILKQGKKRLAEKIVSETFSLVNEKTSDSAIKIFEIAVKNTTPLVVKEALICGLGVVVSEQVSVELDASLDFIDVIPEDKIEDLSYICSILEKNKEYRKKHSEKIKAQKKSYYLTNKNKIKLYHKNNKAKRNKYLHKRRKTDTMFRINNSLRVRIKELLMKQKDDAYSTLLGCSKKDLKIWIEHQFNHKINWNNYGTEWHIDHVYPVKSFNLQIKEERMTCFNWSNLRPLSKEENMAKSSKILQADNLLGLNFLDAAQKSHCFAKLPKRD